MNYSLSTATTKTITKKHGQTIDTHSSGAMQLEVDESRNSESQIQPDVMDVSVDPSEDIETDTAETNHPIIEPAIPSPQVSPRFKGGERDGGAPFLLCRQVHRWQNPHPAQDLLALYNLQPLAATVARSDPKTGEKINKMRRSYEGQVKNLGLAGRNKAVKHEEGKPGGLAELMQWPDEEWDNQKLFGKELEKGLSATILANLDQALRLKPGSVPRNEEWENVLGHEKSKPQQCIPEQKGKAAGQPLVNSKRPNGIINGGAMTIGTPSAGEAVRPKRSGRKRRYDEPSFEGYGEGYVDDDGELMSGGGYSSGEGSRKSSVSKKRRKKDYPAISPSTLGDRAGSYGVGMVGVGSGIGAYGR